MRRAVATGLLVTAQVLVWLAVVFFYREEAWLAYALVPQDFSALRLLVSPFIHVHPYHLGLNLAVLWLFGSNLERAIGTPRFFALYLGAAWFVGLMHWGVTHAAQMDLEVDAAGAAIGAVGSSGALAGVLGVYAVRLPHHPVRVGWLRWPPVPVLAAWLLWEFVQAIISTATRTGAGVGHWAHFAGFVFGLAAGQLLRLHTVARREELAAGAQAAISGGDYAAAAEIWATLVRAEPGNASARAALVEARMTLDDYPAAEAAAQEGLAVAIRSGDPGTALAAYRLYHELIPQLRLPTGARYRIGCWLAEAGDAAAAYSALMEAAREDAATPAAASALFRAGEIAAGRLRDPRRARAAWQKILLDYADSPWKDRAYESLGKLSGSATGR